MFLNICYTIWPVGGRERAQNTPGGCGNISGYRQPHSENYYFLTCSADFRPSQPDTHLPNSATKSAHAIAPCLSLTHPERCAAKFCARRCQKFLGIFHLRPHRDQNVAPQRSPKSCCVTLSSSSVVNWHALEPH